MAYYSMQQFFGSLAQNGTNRQALGEGQQLAPQLQQLGHAGDEEHAQPLRPICLRPMLPARNEACLMM